MALNPLCGTLTAMHLRNGETAPEGQSVVWRLCTTKLLLIMNFTAIFLFVVCLTAGAHGYTQITINQKNTSLHKLFKELKKQTGYDFVYSTELVEKAGKVSVDLHNVSLEDALAECLKGKGLGYTILERTVVIKAVPAPVITATTTGVEAKVTIDVSGRVTDAEGNPLAGASVRVKGTTNGTTTDASGVFVLKGVDENATLIFSYAEHEDVEIKIGKRSGITVALKRTEGNLQEVVINKGYYTEKQKYSVSNVGRVTAKDIEKQPVGNPLLALQGRIPGLFITQNSGLPGGGITVRIQGQNSIRGGNDPLYVIDGVPYIPQMLTTTSAGSVLQKSGPDGNNYQLGGVGNPLSYINPNDIESIDILKDADATSIYGSRAANGAILITTKRGKMGKTKVDFNLQQGWGKVTRMLKMLNTEQYVQMRKEALANDGITVSPTDDNYDVNGLWDTTRNTDWGKTLIGGTAHYTNINATFSGGNANTQYLIGSTFRRETTVFPGDFDDKKASVHFNINTKSENDKFRLQLSANYLTDNNQLPRDDYTLAALLLPPNSPALYKSDGTLNWAPNLVGNSSWSNPLSALNKTYQNKTDYLAGSAFLSYTIVPGLVLSNRLGYTKLMTNEIAANSSLAQKPENRANPSNRSAQFTSSAIKVFLIEPQINYNNTIGKGKLEILLGATIQQNQSAGQAFSGRGFANDNLIKDIRSATTLTTNSTVDAKYKYNAGYGRINYNWLNRYIINLNARRDGSSHFGPDSRFHNFASVGAAWIFSDESFFKNYLKFLNFGKLKASYGTTGNDQVGDYTYMDLYTSSNPSVPYQGGSTLDITGISNPFLHWEETRKLSLGIDLGFLDERILFNASYNRNQSSNQLLPYILPISTGFSSINRNFPATVQNASWEFSLNTTNVTNKNFEWKSSFNLTLPKNKLLKFPNLETSSYANALLVGQPLTIVKAYHYVDVDPSTGVYRFAAKDGTLTLTPDWATDRYVLINIDPKYYGGFQNSIKYRNFQVDAFFQFVKQTQSSSYRFGISQSPGSLEYNQPVSVLNRWQKPGDISSVQRYNSDYSIYTEWENSQISDAEYVDASYIRLENISVSYELTSMLLQKLRLQRCRLYMQGQNLFTITKFKGIDPENRSLGSLAPLKVLTFGLQVGF